MPKFRKKPVVIEAEQFTYATNKKSEHPVKTGDMFMEYPIWIDKHGPCLIIPTLEGNHRADPGDWIITGVKGERYPCKPEIFVAMYELVS